MIAKGEPQCYDTPSDQEKLLHQVLVICLIRVLLRCPLEFSKERIGLSRSFCILCFLHELVKVLLEICAIHSHFILVKVLFVHLLGLLLFFLPFFILFLTLSLFLSHLFEEFVSFFLGIFSSFFCISSELLGIHIGWLVAARLRTVIVLRLIVRLFLFILALPRIIIWIVSLMCPVKVLSRVR